MLRADCGSARALGTACASTWASGARHKSATRARKEGCELMVGSIVGVNEREEVERWRHTQQDLRLVN